MTNKKKIGMVSLGCAKNQVDGERLLAMLSSGGYELCADAAQCDGVIINTCAFVEDAKQESIDAILEFCAMKRPGQKKVVVVTGCLAERYREMVAEEIPEVDGVVGIGCNGQIVDALNRAFAGEQVLAFDSKDALSMEGERVLANPSHYAYLKVAEGCDNACTFCAIPLIRGKFRSRPMKNIIEEAVTLAKQGVTELNVVAQDTTRYGHDLYGEVRLPQLLQALCQIPEIKWIRVLYAYPERMTDKLLEVMRSEEKVLPYFDIPLQHCSRAVLKRMGRPGDSEKLTSLMKRIREKVPGAVIRTTLIAGFPGETQEAFEELCQFVQEAKFERLGCFSYSREEDTPAAQLDGQLEEDVKRRRAEIIMETQYPVAQKFLEGCVGKTFTVLTEEQEDGFYVGRTYMDAPEVDGHVYFTGDRAFSAGEYVQVLITGVRAYDLEGKAIGG